MSKKRSRSSLPLYMTEKSDVVVVDFHGQEYHLHRKALAEYSEFFQALFGSGEWKENTEGRVELKFEDPCNLFSEVVAFIYSGFCNSVDMQTICPLLIQADQLQIPKLRDFLLNEQLPQLMKESRFVLFQQALKHNATHILENCAEKMGPAHLTWAFWNHALSEESMDLSYFAWLVDTAADNFSKTDLTTLHDLKILSCTKAVKALDYHSMEFKISTLPIQQRSSIRHCNELTLFVDVANEKLAEQMVEKYLSGLNDMRCLFLHPAQGTTPATSVGGLLSEISKKIEYLSWLELDHSFVLDDNSLPELLKFKHLEQLNCSLAETFTKPDWWSSLLHIPSLEFKNVLSLPHLAGISNLTFLQSICLPCPEDASIFWPSLTEICKKCAFLQFLGLDFSETTQIGQLPEHCANTSVLALEIALPHSGAQTILDWLSSCFQNVHELVLEDGDNIAPDCIFSFANVTHLTVTNVSFSFSMSEALLQLIGGLPKIMWLEAHQDKGGRLNTKNWDSLTNGTLTHFCGNLKLDRHGFKRIGQSFPNIHHLEVECTSSEVFLCVHDLMENAKTLKMLQLACPWDTELRQVQFQVNREYPQLDLVDFQHCESPEVEEDGESDSE